MNNYFEKTPSFFFFILSYEKRINVNQKFNILSKN
jgi:hypothetical protein